MVSVALKRLCVCVCDAQIFQIFVTYNSKEQLRMNI